MNEQVLNKVKKAPLDVAERTIKDVYSNLYIPEIIDVIETSYDYLSDSVVFSRNSRLNLIKFKSLFMDRVNEFEYLKLINGINSYTIEMDIPDVDSFDFSNGLEILELITLGVPANYVEVDERTRRKIGATFPKAPLSFRVDNTIVYLYDVKRYNTILTTLREKKIEVMMFPFSAKNKGFDVFDEANDYDDDNFDSMLELVHTNIAKDLKTDLRR
jgi:hypothetical protein